MSKKKHSRSKKEPEDFQVPNGYFENGTKAIMQRIAWEEEHKVYENLVKYRNTRGFEVPDDYFSKKEQNLEMIPYPALNLQDKENAFTIPPDYFIFSSAILEAVTDLREEPRLWGTLPKQNAFKIDPDYFSKNAEVLRDKLNPPHKGRIIRLFPNRVLYPAAAALLIVLGLWTYDFYFRPETIRDCGSMACIDKSELTKSKDLESLDEDQLYDIVNSKELENKLEKNGNKVKENRGDSNLKPSSVDELLDEI